MDPLTRKCLQTPAHLQQRLGRRFSLAGSRDFDKRLVTRLSRRVDLRTDGAGVNMVAGRAAARHHRRGRPCPWFLWRHPCCCQTEFESKPGRQPLHVPNSQAHYLDGSANRHRKPPSQAWRTFLDNHLKNLVSVDFFTVPTIRFQILYVFLVLAHDRHRVLHFNVTDHPTAEWAAQQLRDAFPWNFAPHYLLRDRDRIFGGYFSQQVKDLGIKQVLSAPRSPWQRACAERMIGTIRRECLDHITRRRCGGRFPAISATTTGRERTGARLKSDG